jgi:hypothetical protein
MIGQNLSNHRALFRICRITELCSESVESQSFVQNLSNHRALLIAISFLKKKMNSQQQLDELKSAIAAIQQEISVAKEERKVAKETLEKAIAEEKPTSPHEKLVESAQAELTRLRQEELILMKMELDIAPAAAAKEISSSKWIAFDLMTEMWERRFTYDGKSTSLSKRATFKPILARDYLQIPENGYHSKSDIACQILGIEFPKFLVTGSHIFKHEWAGDAWILLRIRNINSSRNGLLLFSPIEKAFNRSQLCFLKSEDEDSFYLKILDPSIRDFVLFDECKKFVNKEDCKKMNKTRHEVLSFLKDALSGDGCMLTFGDIEGRTLICKGNTRPYKRCLNFHASRARTYALKKGWIKDDVVFKFTWSSQEYNHEIMNTYLEQLHSAEDVVDEASIEFENVDDIMPSDAVAEEDSNGKS